MIERDVRCESLWLGGRGKVFVVWACASGMRLGCDFTTDIYQEVSDQ